MNGRLPFLIFLAKATYGKFISAGEKIILDNSCKVDLEKGPYLFLFNHAGIMDPVTVSAVMPKHIRWVAGAYLFKNPFLKFIIGKCCTAIPKQQGRSDLSMLKNIKNALKDGDNVGLFPEGTRTWDGNMVPYSAYSVARFVKFCKVPVVIVNLQGAYAKNPRWADYKRKGRVIVKLKEQISADEIKDSDIKDLEYRIEKGLNFSNDKWKKKNPYLYQSIHRAEGVQRLLYMCPNCNEIDTIKAEGNEIFCSSCNLRTVLDEKDNLDVNSAGFTTLAKWHEWEVKELVNVSSFPVEKGVLFQVGDANDDGVLETISKDFSVRLINNALIIRCKKRYRLPFEKITSFVLNAKQTMELFCNDTLYRIRLLPDACSLKYHEYYLMYTKNREVSR